MENKNNNILNQYFAENKHEIPDNGFSKNVRQQLPLIRRNHIIIGFFSYAGITLSLLLAIKVDFFRNLFFQLKEIPPYYLLASITLVPVIYFLCILFAGRNSRYGLL